MKIPYTLRNSHARKTNLKFSKLLEKITNPYGIYKSKNVLK